MFHQFAHFNTNIPSFLEYQFNASKHTNWKGLKLITNMF